MVADRENRRLQLFDLEGKVLRVASEGLRRPCTGDRHPDGTLAVADIDGKVTLLDKNGAPVVHLGEQPDPEKRDRKDVPAAQQGARAVPLPPRRGLESRGRPVRGRVAGGGPVDQARALGRGLEADASLSRAATPAAARPQGSR